MDWKIFTATFGTIFLAEMGDKTQLAALTMTSQTRTPLVVLVASCAALCLATVIAVAAGGVIGHLLPPAIIKRAAGAAFIAIGVVMVWGRW